MKIQNALIITFENTVLEGTVYDLRNVFGNVILSQEEVITKGIDLSRVLSNKIISSEPKSVSPNKSGAFVD